MAAAEKRALDAKTEREFERCKKPKSLSRSDYIVLDDDKEDHTGDKDEVILID